MSFPPDKNVNLVVSLVVPARQFSGNNAIATTESANAESTAISCIF
jgi:hypothetical protein